MYDFAIIGGGIVGLATAYRLGQAQPKARILLIEKERRWASHQTGHNSGVIHSGIYYKPGSAKARLAVAGVRALEDFCQTNGVPFLRCGKVIVAASAGELPRLEALAERAKANGIIAAHLAPEELQEKEPHVRGLAALWVPSTGIVDYRVVALTLARLAAEQGAELRLSTKLLGVHESSEGVNLQSTQGDFTTRFLINTGGLYSDHIARFAGAPTTARIIPFRGEYYELLPTRHYLVKGLIYPVPNPNFPFLGVHFTRMIDGGVHAGPNAVLALRREGYRKTDLHLGELAETLTYPAFWKLALRNANEGIHEVLRSLSKALFVRSMQTLIPEITAADVRPSGAGVRAQALASDGTLVEDFLFIEVPRQLHVCNAPSPAATASLEIAREITARTLARS